MSEVFKYRKNVILIFLLLIVVFFIVASIVSNPRTTNVYKLYPAEAAGVTFQNFNFGVVLVLVLEYLFITFLGYSLISPFFVSLRDSRFITKFIASFFVGHLCCMAVIRFVSIFFSYTNSYFAILIFLFAIILFLHRKSIFSIAKGSMPKLVIPSKRSLNLELLIGGGFLFLLFCLLILQITQHYYYWSGHGPKEYAIWLDFWAPNSATSVYSGLKPSTFNLEQPSFPIILQHADDLVFHYFLTLPFVNMSQRFFAVLPWWITLGLMKISLAAFFYLCFRKLKCRFWNSWIYTMFLVLGTTSLLPYKYYLLYDSVNPIFLSAAPGRIVGIAAVILFVVINALQGKTLSRISMLMWGLLSFGLTLTVISNSLWFIAASIFILAIFLFGNVSGSYESHLILKRKAWAGAIVAVFSLLLTVLLYVFPFENKHFYTLRLFSSVLVFLFGMISVGVCLFSLQKQKIRVNKSFKQRYLVRFFIIILASVFSLGIFSNIFVNKEKVKGLLSKIPGVQEKIAFWTMKKIDLSVKFEVGDFRTFNGYDEGPSYQYEFERGGMYFIAFCGLIMVIILFAFRNYLEAFYQNRLVLRRDDFLFNILIFFVCLLPIIFLMMSFVNTGVTFMKSRFLEVPMHVIVFISLYFIDRFLKKRYKIFFCGILIIYSIVPVLATQRLIQLYQNFILFLNLL